MNWASCEFLDRRLHLGHGAGLPTSIDEEGGDVRLGAGQVAEEFQQADDLGDPCVACSPFLGPVIMGVTCSFIQ